MSKIRCPKCGYTEDDGRPHDRTVYHEMCVVCEPPTRKATGKVFARTADDLAIADAFTPPDPFSRKV